MKNIALLSFVFVFTYSFTNAQINTWKWAKKEVSTDTTYPYQVCTDVQGNTIQTGAFSGNLKLGNTPSISGLNDIFVTKTDNLGNYIWSRAFNGNGIDRGLSICTDAQSNVYIIGDFDGTSLTIGTTTLMNLGGRDSFLIKLNPNGNLVWVQHIGSNQNDDIRSVTTDGSKNVIIGGSFWGDLLTVGAVNLFNSSTGSPDPLLVKYDSLGVVTWAISGQGEPGKFDGFRGISTDNVGNVFCVGETGSNFLSFGTTQIGGNGTGNRGYLIKVSAAGSCLWGNLFEANQSYCRGISVNKLTGDLFVVGQYYGNGLMYNGISLANNNLNIEGFLAKINKNGSGVWIKSQSGVLDEICWSAAATNNGSVIVAGTTNSNSLLLGNFNRNSYGKKDGFLVVYDSIGVEKAAEIFGGSEADHCQSVATDMFTSAYVVSYHDKSNIVYRPISFSSSLGNNIGVLAKYSYAVLPISKFSATKTTICAADCIDFIDSTLNNPTAWSWSFAGSPTPTSSVKNPKNICFPNAGTFRVSLIASNSAGASLPYNIDIVVINAGDLPVLKAFPSTNICPGTIVKIYSANVLNPIRWNDGSNYDTLIVTKPGVYTVYSKDYCGKSITKSIEISAFDAPKPIIIQNCYQLLAKPDSLEYQWYFNNEPIKYANAQSYQVVEYFGNYQVQIVTNDGCKVLSEITKVQRLNIDDLTFFAPNPNDGNFAIKLNKELIQDKKLTVFIYDLLGQLVYFNDFKRGTNPKISFAPNPTALYLVKIVVDGCEIGVKKALVIFN